MKRFVIFATLLVIASSAAQAQQSSTGQSSGGPLVPRGPSDFRRYGYGYYGPAAPYYAYPYLNYAPPYYGYYAAPRRYRAVPYGCDPYYGC
jgi:hypothetical protein